MAKRLFDFIFAITGLVFTGWLIIIFYIAATISTGHSGIFKQLRIGRYGKMFTIFKLRSMKDTGGIKLITPLGRFMRRYKIDELPQLINILAGNMSFVGPRPDIPGYYDLLQGEDRKLLLLRPGLTGPASLKYANEEELLAASDDPEYLNDHIIFPDKVRINRAYQENQSLWLDIKLIVYTALRRQPGEEFLQ